MARSRAQRSNLAHFVVLNRRGPTVVLVGPDMSILRERELPSSVELVIDSEGGIESIHVPPSGLLRGQRIQMRSRFGPFEVAFQ